MSSFPKKHYGALERYAPDRQPVPTDLCDNTNLWGAHPAAAEIMRSPDMDALTRYPSVYADPLRSALAEKFGVSPDSVTTGCGSDDLLDSTFRAVCEPGDRIAYLVPTFSMIEIFATMNGIEPVALPGWPTPPDPELLLEGDPGLIYLCSPNNPTGGPLEREWIERLLDAVGPRGPIVLLDEAYVEFMDVDGDAPGSMIREAAGSERLVVLRTFSKAYGLAGLRVGYAVGPEGVIAEIEKSRGPYKVGKLAENAAVAALEDREGWLDFVTGGVRENRRRLMSELLRRGFPVLPSQGNFLLLPLAPRLASTGARDASLALRERGVAVRPFPALPGIGEGLRITIGPWELMERFLEALDDAFSPGRDA